MQRKSLATLYHAYEALKDNPEEAMTSFEIFERLNAEGYIVSYLRLRIRGAFSVWSRNGVIYSRKRVNANTGNSYGNFVDDVINRIEYWRNEKRDKKELEKILICECTKK